MAKMLGQDLFTQNEFDKFKKEYDDLVIQVKLQGDEINKFKNLSKATLVLSCVTFILLAVHYFAS